VSRQGAVDAGVAEFGLHVLDDGLHVYAMPVLLKPVEAGAQFCVLGLVVGGDGLAMDDGGLSCGLGQLRGGWVEREDACA